MGDGRNTTVSLLFALTFAPKMGTCEVQWMKYRLIFGVDRKNTED